MAQKVERRFGYLLVLPTMFIWNHLYIFISAAYTVCLFRYNTQPIWRNIYYSGNFLDLSTAASRELKTFWDKSRIKQTRTVPWWRRIINYINFRRIQYILQQKQCLKVIFLKKTSNFGSLFIFVYTKIFYLLKLLIRFIVYILLQTHRLLKYRCSANLYER